MLQFAKSKKQKKEQSEFTVPCLVAWPLSESEGGGDLVFTETSLLFLC